jgi:hypothetical protein
LFAGSADLLQSSYPAQREGNPSPLSRSNKLAFTAGAIAPAITMAAFDFFLLFFCSLTHPLPDPAI